MGNRHGLWKDKNTGKISRLYKIWEDMKSRCYNSNNKRFKDYGAIGIKMNSEWKYDYKAFYLWAINNGYSDTLTIDRIDNKGDYEPNNCKWSTQKEQANNRNTNIVLEYNGQSKTMQQWSDELNMPKHILRHRIKRGWTTERALTTKKGKYEVSCIGQ